MSLSPLDWSLFFLFFVLVIGVSLYKSRGSSGGEEGYFLAGRGLSWWLIGISIVAANISTEQFVGMAGQGAGAVGLAVSWWQLIGSVGIAIIAFTLLPRFLEAGIYTMPEYLEYRYNVLARSIFAVLTVVVYVVVLLTAVLFSGGLTLHTIFGIDLSLAVWIIGLAAAIYTSWGGLKAVAWADLLQGVALLAGGLVVFFVGLAACGGWSGFSGANAGKLHMVLPASDENLPWTGVISGMWIVLIYYCGLNQFIVQRNLAARTLKDGQFGMIFAGGLWLLVPFAIVMPGIMAFQLYPEALSETPDKAYPTLITNLLPAGMRGFLLAALAGAIASSLASMLNSASTIFSLDVVQRLFRRDASHKQTVWLGRISVIVFVSIGCLARPSVGGSALWRSISVHSAISRLHLARCSGGVFVRYDCRKDAPVCWSHSPYRRTCVIWADAKLHSRYPFFGAGSHYLCSGSRHHGSDHDVPSSLKTQSFAYPRGFGLEDGTLCQGSWWCSDLGGRCVCDSFLVNSESASVQIA